MRVDAVNRKGHDAASFGAVLASYNVHVWNRAHLLDQKRGKLVVVGRDLFHADFHKVFGGGGHSHRAPYVDRARLKFFRNRRPCGSFARDVFYHLAAAQKWRHFFQEFPLCVKAADSGGAAKFVAAKGVKVYVQVLDIDRNVGKRLRSVGHDDRPFLVGQGRYFFYRVCRSQNV